MCLCMQSHSMQMFCSGDTAVQRVISKSRQFKQTLLRTSAAYLANTFDPSVLVLFIASSDGGAKIRRNEWNEEMQLKKIKAPQGPGL